MKSFRKNFEIWFQDPKSKLSLAIGLALVVVFLSSQFVKGQAEQSPSREPSLSSDELIPEGFTLVTIELMNQEAIQSLVGGYAMVDLFAPGKEGESRGILVGKQIKLIRTPENPKQFSALVPEAEAPLLLGQPMPLFAVIKSRKSQTAAEVLRQRNKSSRIHFLGE